MRDTRTSSTRELRNALGTFATGVTVVTARDANEQPFGMTANSFASVSLEPPMILWNVAKDAWCYERFRGCEYFAVHVLKQSQQGLSEHFARRSNDKFSDIPWQVADYGVPQLDEYIACFVCETIDRIDAGDHLILLANVVAHDVQSHDSPLLFHRGLYGALE